MYRLVLLALCEVSLIASEHKEVAAMVRDEVVAIEAEAMSTQEFVLQDLNEEEIAEEEMDSID